ncbi:MAG: macro domain-containing protein [Phycisphaeraceae bacterium]|nr:macro domain-containing protein [Phycisphaeraceae bacterium]
MNASRTVHRKEWSAGTFQIVIGDLLSEPVDCIVNAANGHLNHAGGVAAAIARAAGETLQAECRRYIQEHGPLESGTAVATGAGDLPFKAVIHAVGPRQGEGLEADRIARALFAAFDIAHDRGYGSCSFPAVSSGIFGVPADVCAQGYRRAVEGFFTDRPQTPLRNIRLCLLEGPLVDVARAAF